MLYTSLFLLLLFSSCAKIAVMAAPKKVASIERTSEALKADEFFWKHFHAGDYDKIDDILGMLTLAYMKDPRDAVTASHIGFMHTWRVAERSRLLKLPQSMIDEAELARFYFAESHKLNPKDPRVFGFLADMTMASGFVHYDEKKIREGYFLGLDAIRQWPEFNLFSVGYVLSTRDSFSDQFKEALKWQWENLDLCAGEKVNRKNPDVSSYMKNEERDKKIRRKSVCWNSWIAPHNFEGFMLNMGDMLLKAGDKDASLTVYSNARLSKTYNDWPYRHVLEQRLLQAHEARQDVPDQYTPKPMMFESSFSCMACHQEK